jgi:hypothetical protein
MRVISLWQPYASLLVRGFKLNETRPFPCPPHIVGTRIGIASTKIVRPEQRDLVKDPTFSIYYEATGLPALDDLPHGCLLGSVFVHSSDIMTEDDLEDTTEEEQIFGDWKVGRYAWRCRDPEYLTEPVPVRGQQGIWTLTDGAKILDFSRAL